MSPARLRPGVILRLPRASAHLAIGLAARAAILAAAALPTWLALALARLAADVAYA
ncbi:MAG: hypothetical protein HY721_07245, partial [Planctomycetes bacterium]|nr:hypothetical protein [Planctomycetota bacterium]